jgi:hypothetical protein
MREASGLAGCLLLNSPNMVCAHLNTTAIILPKNSLKLDLNPCPLRTEHHRHVT